MNVLGIDPGIGRTGWAIAEENDGKINAIAYGCLKTESSTAVEKRLHEIFSYIETLIQKHHPDIVAVEELFFNTNAKTAFIVGQARGVMLLAAAKNDLPVAIYTPLQVKIAVTGYGRAEKSQVGQMVQVLLRLKTIPRPDDTTDALAVALTHLFSQKLSSSISKR